MIGYVKIIRPTVVLLTALGVFIGAFLSHFTVYSQILLAMVSASLIAAGGNALNDYFDYKTDRINKPHRPIPSGKVRREDVLIFSLVLLITGFILSFLLNIYTISLALINIVVIFGYNALLKRFPLLGNFGPSWLAASSFVYGGLLTQNIIQVIVLLFSMSFLATTGREIVKSLEDVAGDSRTGVRTLPVISGKNFSVLAAIIFILLAIGFSILPYAFNLLNAFYITFIILADLIFIISLLFLDKSVERSQRFMKIAMFLSIFAFFVGAL